MFVIRKKIPKFTFIKFISNAIIIPEPQKKQISEGLIIR